MCSNPHKLQICDSETSLMLEVSFNALLLLFRALLLFFRDFTGELGKIFSSFLALAVDAWIATVLPGWIAMFLRNQRLKHCFLQAKLVTEPPSHNCTVPVYSNAPQNYSKLQKRIETRDPIRKHFLDNSLHRNALLWLTFTATLRSFVDKRLICDFLKFTRKRYRHRLLSDNYLFSLLFGCISREV